MNSTDLKQAAGKPFQVNKCAVIPQSFPGKSVAAKYRMLLISY